MQKKFATVIVLAALLAACGGGGGNPGQCFGSAEVCAEGDNPNSVQAGGTTTNSAAPAPVDNSSTAPNF